MNPSPSTDVLKDLAWQSFLQLISGAVACNAAFIKAPTLARATGYGQWVAAELAGTVSRQHDHRLSLKVAVRNALMALTASTYARARRQPSPHPWYRHRWDATAGRCHDNGVELNARTPVVWRNRAQGHSHRSASLSPQDPVAGGASLGDIRHCDGVAVIVRMSDAEGFFGASLGGPIRQVNAKMAAAMAERLRYARALP
jgi:hypothetical protein